MDRHQYPSATRIPITKRTQAAEYNNDTVAERKRERQREVGSERVSETDRGERKARQADMRTEDVKRLCDTGLMRGREREKSGADCEEEEERRRGEGTAHTTDNEFVSWRVTPLRPAES